MSDAFGFVLDDASLRRAAVEGVPETVITAIYLSMSGASARWRPSSGRTS